MFVNVSRALGNVFDLEMASDGLNDLADLRR